MLQAAARDDVASVGQRFDHRIVGVTFVAVFFQHAFAFKAGRGLGHHAIAVNREGN